MRISGGLEEKPGADIFKTKQNKNSRKNSLEDLGEIEYLYLRDTHLLDLQPSGGVLTCRRSELRKSPEAPSVHDEEVTQRRMCRKPNENHMAPLAVKSLCQKCLYFLKRIRATPNRLD